MWSRIIDFFLPLLYILYTLLYIYSLIVSFGTLLYCRENWKSNKVNKAIPFYEQIITVILDDVLEYIIFRICL